MTNDAFFRKATLAICGNLQIETAMKDCIEAIQESIPVDRMFLQVYEADLGAMRTIAMASSAVAQQLDVLTPMPQQIRDVVRRNISRYEDGFVAITSAEDNPIAAEMLRFHGIEGSSILQMTLTTQNGRFGGIVLTADRKDRYSSGHVELLRMLQKPFTIALFNTLTHREVLSLRDRLADDNRYLHRELHRMTGDEIVGADFGLKEVMHLIGQVAPTESPVLITGETGVGKDVVAGAIHRSSERRSGPFIAVNCGAIPESLIDSELFGHEKGAFTGALSQKRGRFERAHMGTIFLDEIGEMPLSAQVRLLRVLQNHEIERVGGVDPIPVDIRVIAATNRDLEHLIQEQRFRQDLWFRLNVFPIGVPALRDRIGDIPALVQHFIEQKAKELKLALTPTLAPAAIEQLLAYPWPGNVRELANVIERAMIVSRDGTLRFTLDSRAQAAVGRPASTEGERCIAPLDDAIADHIRLALDAAGGKIHGDGGAGELLGVNPNTLRNRMKKLGIPFRGETACHTRS
jgi:formate hydrogenlyase transcriptional activator